MGLFRRKHKPWDEFFNVITEFPSTNPDGMSFDFPIPYYYHAKLIHISFTYFLSGVLPVLSRAAALTVSRGNNVITRGKWPAFSTQGFSVLYFSSVGALHSARLALPLAAVARVLEDEDRLRHAPERRALARREHEIEPRLQGADRRLRRAGSRRPRWPGE